MRKTMALFTVAMACALPLAASANPQSSNTASVRPSTRGGGPAQAPTPASPAQAATPALETRAQQLHAASPHIITVQSKIDAAQAEARGIERLAALASQPLTGEYREHLRGLEQDLQSDVSEARHHLDHLRSAVRGMQNDPSVNTDLGQADVALQQVRTELERFASAEGHGAAHASTADTRAFGTTLTRGLNDAKRAMERVERDLH